MALVLVWAVMLCAAPASAQDRPPGAGRLSSEDQLQWRRVAQDSYLIGDVHKALKAWNLLGEPLLERIEVRGEHRTREGVITGLVGLKPGDLITSPAFLRAARRLDDLPAASQTLLQYVPLDAGRAGIDARLEEHHVFPHDPFALAAIGSRAIVNREIRVDFAGITRSGENLAVSWRQQAGWKRRGVELTTPAPGPLPGLMVLDAYSEDQTYALVIDNSFREKHEHVGLAFTDWASGQIRWEAGGNWDRFDDREFGGLDLGVETRFAQDHLSASLSASGWTPLQSGREFGVGRVAFVGRTTTTPEVPNLSFLVGATAATDAAPLALWPGAGSTQSRDGLLRAHALRRNGTMTGEVVGRTLAYGSVEYEQIVYRSAIGPVYGAVFADTARASRRFDTLPSTPWETDLGVGVRLRASASGLVRFDIARSVRDGRTKVSVGFLQKWPRR